MSDLAGFRDGVAARFVPDVMRDALIEAEHLARYRWAAQLAAGRRVLDAGCGTGYGSALLAATGAREVVGVDHAEDVLDSARRAMPETVRLDAGDLARLPYDDGAFDLVVCFNVVEHVEDAGRVFDELVRVLAVDGVLIVSTPNRAARSHASPHHRQEYLPEELRHELRSRLSHVTPMRQDVYLTVAVLRDAQALSHDGELDGLSLHTAAVGELGQEEFAVAVAGRSKLPAVTPLALLTSSLHVKVWVEALAQCEASAAATHARILELEEENAMRVATGAELESRAHTLGAELGAVGEERDVVRQERDATLEERDGALLRAERAERILSMVTSSPSWRLTAPLRRLKRTGRSLRGRIRPGPP